MIGEAEAKRLWNERMARLEPWSRFLPGAPETSRQREILPPKDAAADLAQKILAAAELARKGGHPIAPPPAGSVAARILAAGRKARFPDG